MLVDEVGDPRTRYSTGGSGSGSGVGSYVCRGLAGGLRARVDEEIEPEKNYCCSRQAQSV